MHVSLDGKLDGKVYDEINGYYAGWYDKCMLVWMVKMNVGANGDIDVRVDGQVAG